MKDINNSFIEKLIAEIGSLNNEYRYAIRAGKSGREVLEIMWDVGEILRRNRVKKIHPIAWRIYGKAQGVKKSNITRDFLSYCFRIRRFFREKEEIKREFPTLARYSIFREAFPLLDNPNFNLKGKQLISLKKLLNSASGINRTKKIIIELKKKKIGIKNPRTQRLAEFKNEVQNFFQLYEELRNTILKNDIDAIAKLRDFTTPDGVRGFSDILVAFTQEGLKFPKIKVSDNVPPKWKRVWEDLERLANKSVEDRNRFRRLIPPSYLMRLAEMISTIHNRRELKRMRETLVVSG